jgi:hypothetical protein
LTRIAKTVRRLEDVGCAQILVLTVNIADAERDSLSDTSSEYILTQNPKLNGHERKFSPRKQLVRLLGTGCIRFFITGALIAGIYYTVWFYKAKPIMSEEVDQLRFNFLTTGLSMLLGVSIASSLKQVAVDIRWYILSRRNRPLSEVSIAEVIYIICDC